MQISTLLIDLDDTVYPATCGLWDLIKHRISLYMHEKLNLSWEVIPELRSSYYKNYGTTMRGLLHDYSIDKDEYLAYVHDVPLASYIAPDPHLRETLLRLQQRKVIFTNADAAHARRVLEAIGIADCFEKIVDILMIFPYCKPQPISFQIAMQYAGETQPEKVAFLDDSISNLAAARQVGLYTIRVGSEDPSEQYDTGIARLGDICKVLPCS